jgi:hypothetical protein
MLILKYLTCKSSKSYHEHKTDAPFRGVFVWRGWQGMAEKKSDQKIPYSMSIAWNNGAEGFMFPVMPEKISIKHAGSGKEYDIVGAGKISTIEKPDLAEISFESFFPSQDFPYLQSDINGKPISQPFPIFYKDEVAGLVDTAKYVNYLLKWQASGYPMKFGYLGADMNPQLPTYLPVMITSFDRWEEGGSPGDIFYSLKLKEYVFYSAQKLKLTDGKLVKQQPDRPDYRIPPTTWTIKPGDTLTSIAMRLYHDTPRYKEIQKLNNISDAELKTLQVGRVLQLPKN